MQQNVRSKVPHAPAVNLKKQKCLREKRVGIKTIKTVVNEGEEEESKEGNNNSFLHFCEMTILDPCLTMTSGIHKLLKRTKEDQLVH